MSMRGSYNQHGVEPEYRLYRHFNSFSSADLCLTVIATRRKTIRGSFEVKRIIYRRIVQDESGKLVFEIRTTCSELCSSAEFNHKMYTSNLTLGAYGGIKWHAQLFVNNLPLEHFFQDATFIYKIQFSECY